MTQHSSWYRDVTRYQWLVLVIASLGWVFDAFEGQLFNITRADMLPDLLNVGREDPQVKAWGERFSRSLFTGWHFRWLGFQFTCRSLGQATCDGTYHPVLFLFSGLTSLATEVWHVGVLRFLVAMGVGGEWAVGAALVAEVFPARARERASVIFHATSVFGLWLAASVGLWVGSQWRTAYLIGVVPALLVLWVRVGLKEPETWQHAKQTKSDRLGSFSELLGDPRWRWRAIGGALLAMVGLATFWGVVIAGQDLAANLLRQLNDPRSRRKNRKSLLVTFKPQALVLGCWPLVH